MTCSRWPGLGSSIALGLLLWGSLATTTMAQSAAGNSANARSPLGINIAALNYWSTEWPLLDAMKQSGDWLTQCDRHTSSNCSLPAPASEWDTREQSRLDLDTEGWVRALPKADDVGVHYRSVATMLFGGNGGAYPSGQYTVLYDGEGTLEYGLDAIKDAAGSQPGRDVVNVRASDAGMLLRITATDPRHVGAYLRHIRVIPPGGVCNDDPFVYAENAEACQGRYTPFTALDGMERFRFHPLFLHNLRPYRAIRFMDLFRINTNAGVAWAERPRLTDARWSSRNGAPVELALELATTLQADPWLNIPVQASDDYVVQFARLARFQLPADRRVYVEYANEIWNDQFSAGAWLQQQAVQRWPDRPGGPSPFTRRINAYGQRAAEICALWKREWGDARDRVVCVLGGMSANPWVAEQALQCPLWAAENGGHACAEALDALAIAPYFGSHLGASRWANSVVAWTGQPDGGLTLLFQELTSGEILDDPKALALPAVYRHIAAHRALADRYHLDLLAYEGGQHLVGIGLAQNNPRLEQLFLAANRSAAMGALYDVYLDGWRQQGGQLFMHFNSVSRYSRYGSWGAKEAQNQASTPKSDALMRFIAAHPCWWSTCR